MGMSYIKKILAGFALLSIELVITLILFVIALVGFVYITTNVFELKSTTFDRHVFATILPHITDMRTTIMVWFSFMGSSAFLLPANILLAAYFLFVVRHRWYSIRVPVISLGSFLVMSGLKLVFHRPRPLDPVYEAARGFSYPSGHAMSAMTFYGLLIFLVFDKIRNKTMRWLLAFLLVALIFLIGFSRVYLRVHYASDVLAGFSLGLIWLVLTLWVINKIENYTRREVGAIVDNDNTTV